MKKIVFAFLCLMTLSGLLGLITARSTRGRPMGRFELEVREWAREFVRISRNPYASGHLDALLEEVRLKPRLLQALNLAMDSGLYGDAGSQLSPRVMEKISAAVGKSYTLTFPHGGNGQGGGLTPRCSCLFKITFG